MCITSNFPTIKNYGIIFFKKIKVLMKNYVDKLLHKKFMHTSYMYNFVTFQQKKWE